MNPHIEFLKSRRSIRRFKKETPPLELVLKAIEAARYAPSAKNSQPWRFILINDPVVIDKLASIHPSARPLREAPLAIVIACHVDESPTSYMLDCANVTTYLLLSLHALGLGAVWIQTLRNIDEVKHVIGIPDSAVPVAMIATGYPDESPPPRPRRPLEDVVFLNKYGNRLTQTSS